MDPALHGFGQVVENSKRLARRFLTIVENRLELLMTEVQEEQAHVLRLFLLALSVAATGLLAALALTAAVVVWLWNYSPGAILVAVASLYGVTSILLYRRITHLVRAWKSLAATRDQLGKDLACLDKDLT